MAKSGALATAMKELHERLKIDDDEWIERPVNSLERSLILAMKTIANATETEQGRATLLRSAPPDGPACPVELTPDLVGFDHCSYEGYYHTDYTIPSLYFDRAARKPGDSSKFDLDFTYLFNEDENNLDYFTTGQGIRVLTDDAGVDSSGESEERELKRRKAHGWVEESSLE